MEKRTKMFTNDAVASIKNWAISYEKSKCESDIDSIVNLYLSEEFNESISDRIGRSIDELSENIKEEIIIKLADVFRKILKQLNRDENNSLEKSNLYRRVLKMVQVLISRSFVESKIIAIEYYRDIVKSLSIISQIITEKRDNAMQQDEIAFLHSFVRTFIATIQFGILENLFAVSNPDFTLAFDNITILYTRDGVPLEITYNCGLALILMIYRGKRIDDSLTHMDKIVYEKNICNLAIRSAVLAALPAPDIKQTYNIAREGEIYLPDYILNTTLAIYRKQPNESVVILGVCKVIRSLCEIISTEDLYVCDGVLTRKLTVHAWSHLDHTMDVVKHMSRESFGMLIRTGDSEILSETYNLCSSSDANDVCKCIALKSLSTNLSTCAVIKLFPNLPNQWLSYMQLDLPCYAYIRSTYETLMENHFSEIHPDDWYKIWVKPILESYENSNKESLEAILIKAAKLSPSAIVENIKLTGERRVIKLIMNCLAELRKADKFPINGVLSSLGDSPNELWLNCIPHSYLELGVSSPSHDVRLSTLSLLIECPKLSEPLSKPELDLLRIACLRSLSIEQPGYRHRFISFVKKALTRIRDSLPNAASYNNSTENTNADTLLNRTEEYEQFLRFIIRLYVDNLFPSASYARRSTALSILNDAKDLNFWQIYALELGEGDIDRLLFCVADSYEENKSLANSLLSVIPVKQLESATSRGACIETALKLSSSIRPSDSVTAAYIFDLIRLLSRNFPITEMNQLAESVAEIRLENVVPENVEVPLCTDHECATPDCFLYSNILKLYDDLKYNIDASKNEISEDKPLHGKLYCIRFLLSKVDSASAVARNPQWRELILNIYKSCFACNNLSLKVIGDKSPEGYIPNQFDREDTDTVEYMDLEDCDDEMANTHQGQASLVSSWRAAKEASLLLSFLCKNWCTKANRDDQVITGNHLLQVGDHFKLLLCQIRHRGSFEQVYVAFDEVCKAFWQHDDPNVKEKPLSWLKEIVDDIENNSQLLCTSRRSAGLPFIVQAILCSERAVNKKCKSKFLEQIVDKMFNICEGESGIVAKIHALNILRYLFKNKILGEDIIPHAERGIMIAVKGFGAEQWRERNSSNLLLSSLITRIFGVSRSKFQVSKKNKMTTRKFFHQYPTLYDFLLKELTVDESVGKNVGTSQYPVLLILSKLYPSNMEDHQINSKFWEYVKCISLCSGSDTLKIRQLSAIAITPFITPNLIVEYVKNVIKIILDVSISENTVHGFLLQISSILENGLTMSENIKRELAKETAVLLENVPVFLSNETHSSIVKQLFLKTICEIVGAFIYCGNPELVLNTNRVVKEIMRSDKICENDFVKIGSDLYVDTLKYSSLFLELYSNSNDMKAVVNSLECQLTNASVSRNDVNEAILYIMGHENFENDDLKAIFRPLLHRIDIATFKMEFRSSNMIRDYLIYQYTCSKDLDDLAKLAYLLSECNLDGYDIVLMKTTVLVLFNNCLENRNNDLTISLAKLSDHLLNLLKPKIGIQEVQDMVAYFVDCFVNISQSSNLPQSLSLELVKLALHHREIISTCASSLLRRTEFWIFSIRHCCVVDEEDLMDATLTCFEAFDWHLTLTERWLRYFVQRVTLPIEYKAVGCVSLMLFNTGSLMSNFKSQSSVFVPEYKEAYVDDEFLLGIISKKYLDVIFIENVDIRNTHFENLLFNWLLAICCYADRQIDCSKDECSLNDFSIFIDKYFNATNMRIDFVSNLPNLISCTFTPRLLAMYKLSLWKSLPNIN